MTEESRAARAATLAAMAFALLLTGALYWRGLGAGFVGDDFMILHRLRGVTQLADARRFVTGEFFEYYRPLGFLSHAVDWRIAGANPQQFHVTNLTLHLANTALVFLIALALARTRIAALLAALLFGLHASSHEAVLWVSARFDLLATFFSLAAIWCLTRGRGWGPWAAALFLAAVLSKESAVALPIAAAAWGTFMVGERVPAVARRTAPWVAALALYAWARHVAGGLSATGGRLPKAVALAAALACIVALGGERWQRVRAYLASRRTQALTVILGMTLGAAAIACAGGTIGHFAREKLSVAGFALSYLSSPFVDAIDRNVPLDDYWRVGIPALALAALALWALWTPLLEDRRMWFLAALLAATLLPISALTEGKRYLYLPSAVVAMGAGIFVADLREKRRTAIVVAAVFLAASAWQISAKVRDWLWAGSMTREGAAMVETTLAPRCGEGRVLFLTSPVGIRGVYTHFYYETFELPRECVPAVFQVLVRVLRRETTVRAAWDGADRILLDVPDYAGNFSLSTDLREFTKILPAGASLEMATGAGVLRAEPVGAGERLTLALNPAVDAPGTLFYYYSDGAIHPMPPRPSTPVRLEAMR